MPPVLFRFFQGFENIHNSPEMIVYFWNFGTLEIPPISELKDMVFDLSLVTERLQCRPTFLERVSMHEEKIWVQICNQKVANWGIRRHTGNSIVIRHFRDIFYREHWTGEESAEEWVPIFPVFNLLLVLCKNFCVFKETTYSSRFSFVACNSQNA